MSVVGEIGMGKTMLSCMLFERLRPLVSDTVYLANPDLDRDEILGAIARALMPEPPQGNRAHMLAALESVLIERYSQGRRVVVVIDEAHSMPATTLEEICLLSNLETTQNNLLKIVLFGQSELDELLAAPQLRQVKDRISHRFELQPLNAQEASAYLMFRLHKAGWKGGELFDAAALRLLVQASEGRTRKLNMLADKSMLAAYAEGVPQVGIEQVRRAVGDSLPTSRRAGLFASIAGGHSASLWRRFAPAGLGVLAALGIAYLLGSGSGVETRERVAMTQPVTPLVSETGSRPSDSLPPSQPVPAAQAVSSPVLAVAIAAAPARSPSTGAVPAAPDSLPPAAGKTSITEPALVAKLKDNSLAVRMQATDEFIAKPSSMGFTVQLLSQRAPRDAEVLAMANEVQAALDGAAQSATPVLVHNRLYQRQLFHALYTGHFDTRADALAFIQSAPAAIRRHNPVVRSLDAIRNEPVP